jgi:PAS domain S-box-containing protein
MPATKPDRTKRAPGADEAARRYRQLAEIASDWIWGLDADLRCTYVSPNVEARTGFAPERMLGLRPDEMQVWADQAQSDACMRLFAARESFRDIVLSCLRPDGQRCWYKLNGAPVFAKGGGFAGYHGTGTDVTAQVIAETKLRESEERFRQLFESASDWFWEQDEDGRLTYVSPRHEKVTGNTRSKNFGLRRDEYGDTSLNPEQWRAYLAAIAERRPFRDFIYRHARPDANGRFRWTKTSGVPVLDADVRFRGYRGAASDVTAQVEAETRAREAQQRFVDAVEQIGQPLSVFDASDRLTAFNQAYTDLHKGADGVSIVREGLGLRALMEWRVQNGFWRVPPVKGEDVADELIARLHGGSDVWTYELADGRTMLVDHRNLRDGSRVALWTDVTSLRQAEERRHELELQLHHAQRIESLGQLAGGVAHDINNALVPVLAITKQVMLKLPQDSRERTGLELVIKGGLRARDLVRQILAFSRKQVGTRCAFDLAAVVSEGLAMLRASLPATIALASTVEPVPEIVGDPGQLQQVLVNLVTNAAQAIGERAGMVTVALAAAADGQLRLSVSDDGCGMDERTRRRIFEPFFTTKEVGKGTGLGLSVVHGIVTNHGGTITVTSAPGQGTRFDIVLPLAQPAEGCAA